MSRLHNGSLTNEECPSFSSFEPAASVSFVLCVQVDIKVKSLFFVVLQYTKGPTSTVR